MALVNFLLAFAFESLVVDYVVFHKLKSTKLYKRLETSKPRYKEINQQTRNNTDWLKDAIDSSVGIVNKGFETVGNGNNELNNHHNGIDQNTNSNISLVSNNNSTVDLISKGYDSDLNNPNCTEKQQKVVEQSFIDNLESKAESTDVIFSSSPIDNLAYLAKNPKFKNQITDSHINNKLIHVDVHTDQI